MKFVAAALVAMCTLNTSAYAASANIEPNNQPYQGVYTREDSAAPSRAQVQAELQRAKAAGQVTFGNLNYPAPHARKAASGKSRADVKSELERAKATGNYSFGELDYPPAAR